MPDRDHAVASATGVWIKDLPITPEKILRALRERKGPSAVSPKPSAV